MRLALLALLLACGPGAAVARAASLEEANRLYEDGRFAEAARAYEELASARPRSPGLHYNLGNAQFRLGAPGSLGRAIASYQRAFRLAPRDPDIRHNLDFALRRAGEQLVPAGMPSILFLLYHGLSATELLALHWLWFWSTLLLACAHLLRERAQDALRPWLSGSLLLWAVCAGWLGLRWSTGLRAPAVVLHHNAEVRSGPGANFPVSFKVPEGRRVSRLDAKGDWIEIGVLQEGLKGWIAADQVQAI